MSDEIKFLSTWRLKKTGKVGKNVMSLTKKQYNRYVTILKGAWDKKTAWTTQEYNVTRRFDLLTEGEEDKLVKKRKPQDNGVVRAYVADEDLFATIKAIHLSHRHAGINKIQSITRQLYANVTSEAIKIYITFCPRCGNRRHGNCKRNADADSDVNASMVLTMNGLGVNMLTAMTGDATNGTNIVNNINGDEKDIITSLKDETKGCYQQQPHNVELEAIDLSNDSVSSLPNEPEMAMISDSDQLPEQMVKTQHFAPELPVKCEPDQLEVQIVKTQHFTEAMEVQSAVAAATANIIPQSPIESYDPGPEQSLQNSKMRGCTDKDMALSFSASSRPVVVFKKTYVDPEHTDGMMKSLASLWRKRRLCDAKICSGDKNVTLHRLVLFAASPHLMEKNITDGADLEVNLPAGISEDGLKIFVSFLYDGVLNLNEHLYKDVERISNLLKVDKVQKHCREFSASLNEHRQMTSSPLMSIPRRRDNLPKSQKSSNRQTVVLTLSDDSNPAESSLGHPSTHQQPQEHTLTLSQSQYEDLQNNIDERIQALNEHHAFMTSHHDRYPPVTQNSGISLQTATNPTMASESGIKTEPIEILDDDITDYPPTTPPTQDNIKHSKRILNSSKSFASESPGSETMRRSSQNLPSSTVTRTYLPTSKCESGLDMNEMDGIATSGASSTTSPYPVSLVASSGETFPLYTLSSNQS